MSAGKIAWIYEREHELHPFIIIGLNTLVQAGWETAIITADLAAGKPYRVYDDFRFYQRLRNWVRLTQELNSIIKEKEAVANKKVIKSRRHLDGLYGRLTAKERFRFLTRLVVNSVICKWHLCCRILLYRIAVLRNSTIDAWVPYLRGLYRVARIDADVMIASRAQAAVWSAMIAKLRRKRFVYFPYEIYGEQVSKPSRIILALEQIMLRFLVDAVITQNDYRALIYTTERGSRVEPAIVHNYKTPRPGKRRGALRRRLGIGLDKRIVLYEGLLVDGRWLEFLAQTVNFLPEDVVLVMLGQEKLKWLSTHAKVIAEATSTNQLVVAPAVPHDDLPDYIADADVGVIIYDDSVRNNYYCEPGKLSDYIAAGVPVIGPNFPTIGGTLRDLRIGVCFDGHSPEEIASAAMSVMEKPRDEWEMALKDACAKLTWESQAPNLLAAVDPATPIQWRRHRVG